MRRVGRAAAIVVGAMIEEIEEDGTIQIVNGGIDRIGQITLGGGTVLNALNVLTNRNAQTSRNDQTVRTDQAEAATRDHITRVLEDRGAGQTFKR